MRASARRATRHTPCFALAFCVGTMGILGCGRGGGLIMEPRPQATLRAPTFTGSPDSTELVELELTTNQPSAGFQVDLVLPPGVIPSLQGVGSTGRASAIQNSAFQNLSPGRSRVLVFDAGGSASIPAGDGPVLTLSLEIARAAPAGTFRISLENGLVIDGEGEAFELTLEPGEVTVQP